MVDQALTLIQHGLSYFFLTVLPFWLCWQICDGILSVLKVRLRKPWVIRRDL